MLANPSEYRTMMYDAFFHGKQPQPKPENNRRPGSKAPPRARPVPKHALNELAAAAQQLKEIQEARAAPK
jgi:hypothetical protein